jgi:hypothetical protein
MIKVFLPKLTIKKRKKRDTLPLGGAKRKKEKINVTPAQEYHLYCLQASQLGYFSIGPRKPRWGQGTNTFSDLL